MNYRVGVTIWKGIWTWMQTAGVVGAAGVLTLELPEDPGAYTKEMWITFLITLIPALWKVLENFRKNSGVNGKPRWNWPWKVVAPVILVCLMGCATNKHKVVEYTYNTDGTPASKLEVKGSTVSTWGSTNTEGAGELYYTGEGDKFEMQTGNSVKEQKAGSADQLVIKMFEALLNKPKSEPEPKFDVGPLIEEYFNKK